MSWKIRPLGLLLAAAVLMIVNSCGDDDGPTDTEDTEPGIVWSARVAGGAYYLADVSWSAARNMFVAVGDGGAIMTSDDGNVWTRQDSPSDQFLYDVTSTNSEFFAVGAGGTVLSSTDAVTWTESTLDSVTILPGWLYGAVAVDSIAVAVGENGIILRYDGEYWRSAEKLGTAWDLYSVAWSDGLSLFVAVGGNGRIVTSPDGDTWSSDTLITSPTTEWLYDITWSDVDEQFVVVGQNGTILTSPDATSWTIRESRLGAYLYGVTWSDAGYIAVGQNGLILSSSDGAVWTLREYGVSDNLRAVTWSPALGRIVAVGLDQTILASDDGVDWTARVTGDNFYLYDVACTADDDTICLAVGSGGTILSSTYGLEWTLGRADGGDDLHGITYQESDGGRFIVVGDNGRLLISSKGVNWASKSITLNHLYDVTASPQMIVAVGRSGTIMTSVDTALWTRVANLGTSEHFNGVAWSGSAFVAVGENGAVARYDGDVAPDWSLTHLASPQELRGVFWNDSIFVAVGDSGSIVTSQDGVTWTQQLWDVDDPNQLKRLNGAAASNSLYVAVGVDLTIISSSDAETWVGRRQSQLGSLESVTWTGMRFIAIGWDRQIYTSP